MTEDELLELLRMAIWRGSNRQYLATHPGIPGDPQTVLLPDGRDYMVEIKLLEVTGAEDER